jgi:prepilin-type N-terminal cleavage/methylation domain-containing protein
LYLKEVRNVKKLNNKGFTLIELLIVIVILGILAVAVLAVLNPVEQLNRSRDTSKRSDAAELLKALERYYATREAYPWDPVANGGGGAGSAPAAPGSAGTAVSNAWLTELVTANEVKQEFTQRDNLTQLVAWLDTASNTVRVCYDPASTEFDRRAAWSATGANVGAGTGTLMCVPE